MVKIWQCRLMVENTLLLNWFINDVLGSFPLETESFYNKNLSAKYDFMTFPPCLWQSSYDEIFRTQGTCKLQR